MLIAQHAYPCKHVSRISICPLLISRINGLISDGNLNSAVVIRTLLCSDSKLLFVYR